MSTEPPRHPRSIEELTEALRDPHQVCIVASRDDLDALISALVASDLDAEDNFRNLDKVQKWKKLYAGLTQLRAIAFPEPK